MAFFSVVPTTTGVLLSVSPSECEAPVSVPGDSVGASGVAGATVSTTIVTPTEVWLGLVGSTVAMPLEGLDTLPATSVAVTTRL